MNRPPIDQLRAVITRARLHIEIVAAEAPEGQQRLSVGFALGTVKRAANVLKAVEAVADLKLPSEVSALGRVLCESSYNIMWIQEVKGADRSPAEQDEKAQLLLDAATLEGSKIAQRWVKHGSMEKAEGDKALEAEAKVRQRRGLGPKDELVVPKLWARVNESGGDGGTENYDLVYRPMCLDAHPTVQGMVLALGAPEERRLERNLAMVAVVDHARS